MSGNFSSYKPLAPFQIITYNKQMCALYTLKTNPHCILDQFQQPISHFWEVVSELTGSPDKNALIDIRPQGFLKTSLGPVLFQNSKNEFEMRLMNFSLCPSWRKEFPAKFTTYNARMERPHPKLKGMREFIYEIPSWKEAFSKGQTCLVPMTKAIESSYFGKSAGKIIGFHQKVSASNSV